MTNSRLRLSIRCAKEIHHPHLWNLRIRKATLTARSDLLVNLNESNEYIDTFVVPLFKSIVEFLPELKELSDQIDVNMNNYKEELN